MNRTNNPTPSLDVENLIEFTQALVQQQSLSGQEQAVAQRVQAEMQTLGFDQVLIDENGSVLGVIEGAQSGKTLLLDAHIDTVGIAPGVPWTQAPFGAKIIDDALYGRGSADMKGALAAMIHAAAAIDRRQLQGRVVVSASTLEEVLEGVALRPIMERFHPDFVVIGEATELNLNRGGRGRAEVHLETVGRPAHSSSPHLGRNAVLDMMKVIGVIDQLALPVDPLLGPAIMALTDIISDPYPGYSVIPSLCRATYDRRLLAGETAAGVLATVTDQPALQGIELRAQIAEGEHTAYTGATLRSTKFFPAWLLDEDDWFVRRSGQGLQQAGLLPKLGAYRFCTNATYSAGVAKVPTIGFGPARESDAHIVDECLRLPDLIAAARGYLGIIQAVLT
ncbi:MAG: YgeY family selenium metabolism-linked hydrolase [Chloroflexi bacterium]|nr:YgeY family selenium metabolism-linked hydrolase [Chloroflexota bacterium]